MYARKGEALTLEQRTQITALYARGMGFGTVARHVGVLQSKVEQHLKRTGQVRRGHQSVKDATRESRTSLERTVPIVRR